jgi:tRNA-specific 2-thiouridylase
MTPLRVAVAMSGGVDSSAAAAILKTEGYDLVGFSMQLWDQKRSTGQDLPSRCCSIDDLYDARSVASTLGFPYYVVNFEAEFKRKVVRNFVESYRQGLTPSPCVLCNSHMKFEHLVRMAEEVQASFIATGHYARVARDPENGRYLLLRGRDRAKDQSYFLFELTQDQLARAMFPLGELEKAEVRRIARQHGLEVAEKPESQEICFVPDGDYGSFVERHYAEVMEKATDEAAFPSGEIVDREGRVLGTHQGIHRFTVGQRRGLGIAHSQPLYVIEIVPDKGRVVVGERPELTRKACIVHRPNWIAIAALTESIRVSARIRSRHKEAAAVVSPLDSGSVLVEFETPQPAIAPGQACVFYNGDKVVGGGWISRAPVPGS